MDESAINENRHIGEQQAQGADEDQNSKTQKQSNKIKQQDKKMRANEGSEETSRDESNYG